MTQLSSRCPEALNNEGPCLDELVTELTHIWNRSAVSTLVAVGETLIRWCYDGDIERWRARGANAWLRRLEGHERLPFKRKTIYLAVHFYDLSLRLHECTFLGDLGVGHVRAVLGLKQEEQLRLLSAAHKERWTIAQLTEEAAAERRSNRKSGRPPTPTHVKVERQLRQHLHALRDLVHDPMLVEVCSPERIARLINAVLVMESELEDGEAAPADRFGVGDSRAIPHGE